MSSGPALLLEAAGPSESPDGWRSLSDNHRAAEPVLKGTAPAARAGGRYGVSQGPLGKLLLNYAR